MANNSLRRRVTGLAGIATAGAQAGIQLTTPTPLPSPTLPAPLSIGGASTFLPRTTTGPIYGTSPYSLKTPASGFIPAQVQTGPPSYAQWGRTVDSRAEEALRAQYAYGRVRGQLTAGSEYGSPSRQQLYELETNPQKKAEWERKKAEWEEANKPDPYAEMYERIQNLMEDVIGKYETSTEEARRATTERYEDILGQRKGLIETTMEDVKGYGAAEQKEIERGYAKESGRIGANLAARGLSATTIGPALQMGLARRKIGSLAQLRERTGMMRAKLRGGLTEEKLRFMERREDVEPDLGMIAQLLRRVGAGTLPQLLKKA